MKGYLVLSDGSIFNGMVSDASKNVLGKIIFDQEGSVKVNGNTDEINHIALEEFELSSLKAKFNGSDSIQGKIVIDSLPIEFHMYDVKSCY